MSKRKTPPEEEAPPEISVMEKGHIYWFYRAKLDVKKPHDLKDVQRLYMLLSPDPPTKKEGEAESAAAATETKEPIMHRLLILGAKTMPKPIKSHGKPTHFGPRDTRHFAFVDVVTEDLAEIDDILGKGSVSHSQKHGDRTTEAARPVGEGRYDIIRYGTNLTYLAYVLEVPKEPGPPQEEFHISKEGRILIQVKNPRITTTRTQDQAGLTEKATFPQRLQDMFAGIRVKERRFTSPPTPEFFNYRHAEFILIATADDLEKFGEIGRALEAEESDEEEEIDTKFAGHGEKKLLQDLHAEDTPLAEVTDAVKPNPKWA